jgi:hypothetical protein
MWPHIVRSRKDRIADLERQLKIECRRTGEKNLRIVQLKAENTRLTLQWMELAAMKEQKRS